MRGQRSAVFAFVIFACAIAAHAVTYVVPNDREMVRRSDAIVIASALNSAEDPTPLLVPAVEVLAAARA